MSDPLKQQQTLDKLTTTQIHNEIDEPIPYRLKKCSLYRSEGHNQTNCPYKQVHD